MGRQEGGNCAPGLLAGAWILFGAVGLGAVGDEGEDARGVEVAGVVRGVVNGLERELELLGRTQERSDGARLPRMYVPACALRDPPSCMQTSSFTGRRLTQRSLRSTAST